jgi:hypothetical protein
MPPNTATVRISVTPWIVPHHILLELPYKRTPGSAPREATAIPLESVDPQVLAQMCDQFRATVFEKAGKEDPAKIPPLYVVNTNFPAADPAQATEIADALARHPSSLPVEQKQEELRQEVREVFKPPHHPTDIGSYTPPEAC